MNLGKTFTFRINQADKELIETLITKTGLSPSSIFRMGLRALARELKEANEDTKIELQKAS